MNIELYYAPVACPLVPLITLTEAGANFRVHPISLKTGQQKTAEFLKLNPKHKVPLLVVDGDTLSENIAIQTWIARTFPNANLLPADPWDNLQATSWLSFCASAIHPYLSRVNSPPSICSIEGTADNVTEIASNLLIEQFKVVETTLAGREFFFDHFTTVDAYFFWCFRRALLLGLDLSGYEACNKHFKMMLARASVESALKFEKTVIDHFAQNEPDHATSFEIVNSPT